MARNDQSQRKCFTFTWKLENSRLCWQRNKEYISSPPFVVGEKQESPWVLLLFPKHGEIGDVVVLSLCRLNVDNDSKEEIDYEIAFLAPNGTVLRSLTGTKKTFVKGSNTPHFISARRDDVFPTKSSSFRQRDTFTARCKIWKNVTEMSEDMQCIARTRIGVEKISFRWDIEHFSSFKSLETYTIKSPKNNKKLIDIRLFFNKDKDTNFSIKLLDINIKYCSLHVSAVDASGNKIEVLRDEIWHNVAHQMKPCSQFFTKQLMEKNIPLPNDVLTLRCKCAIPFGITMEEIDSIPSNCTDSESDELENRSTVSDNICSVSKSVLNESFKALLDQDRTFSSFQSIMFDNLQSMVNNGTLSDIQLRTSSRAFPAHKFILSARCPKFKTMFSGAIKRETPDYVDIKDLDDDTVSRILRYIYSSNVEQLEWGSATKLYVGANSYQILALQNICSSYLKNNLSLTNACEALVLADKQKDKSLKDSVQKFILQHDKSIMNSEDWKHLMKSNLQLAAETMYLKFQQ